MFLWGCPVSNAKAADGNGERVFALPDSADPAKRPNAISAYDSDTWVTDPVPDPEAWVYEHVVNNGRPAFADTNLLASQRPVQDFIEKKVGCMKPMFYRDYSMGVQVLGSFFGFGSKVALIDGQYFVGNSCSSIGPSRDCVQRGLMVLDVKNRWAAFGISHSRNYWESKYYDVGMAQPRVLTLLFVDDSPTSFQRAVGRIVERWRTEGWMSSFPPDDRNIPIETYGFRCDRPQ